MKKLNKDFAWIIVHKRKIIERLFIILIILNLIMMPFVSINYDLTSYLPDSTQTGKGLELIKEEFGYPGSATIMIEDVTLYEAKQYKDMIQAIEGVDTVSWCDSFGSIYQSETFINYDDIDDYYKDNKALMSVMFEDEDSDPSTGEALEDIETLLGDKGHMIGAAVQNKALKDTIYKEVANMMVIVVILLIIILTLATTSWLEPFLFLSVMAVAVILNKGTDIFIGEVSFLTFAISALLQLAVSTDYSIFLFHAFARTKEDGYEAEEAMVIALRESTKSIIGSGMTTFVGFLALTLMEFTIGYDLGLSMAKGVAMCMFCVIVLMPSLILRSYKWVERTSHRSFFPSFNRTSKVLYNSRRITLAVIIILIIPMFFAQSMTPYTFGLDDVASAEGSKYSEDEKMIQETFGSDSMLIILVPRKDNLTEIALANDLDALPYITEVISLADMLPEGIPLSSLPDSITSELYSEDYMRMIISIATSKSEGDVIAEAYYEIENIVQSHYGNDTYVLGVIPSTLDIENVLVEDYPRVNKLSILAIFIVMAFTFRSVILPILALIPIESAITFNMSMPYFSGMEIMYLGMVMISCVLLGATVDYSILLSNTYMDLRKVHNKKDAAIESIRQCIPSVMTSATIMAVIGYIVSRITTVSVLEDLGILISRGGILGMLFVLILLPALLTIFDGAIKKEQELIQSFLGIFSRNNTEPETEVVSLLEGE